MKATGWVAFDLDGVLLNSDRLHYLAVNEALRPYGERISEEEHLSTFKGLPTLKKCEMLTAMGRLPASAHDNVSTLKQLATRDAITQAVTPDLKVTALLMALQAAGWRQCCCSNSVRDTVFRILAQLDLLDFMDFYLSNQDVRRAKPAPDMYIKSATIFGISPTELVVIEDAEPGKQAAITAGCKLVGVDGPNEVRIELIHRILTARNNIEAERAPNALAKRS